MNVLLILLSVMLATVRNLLSKGISDLRFGTKKFFAMQSVLFLTGGLVLCAVGKRSFLDVSSLTGAYAVLYGILLLVAQYAYTAALGRGNVGICSTVYSLGFIFPTVSGSLFWGEPLNAWNVSGILLVIPTVMLSGRKKVVKTQEGKQNKWYILPLVLAMMASGGLGILQKVQQLSPYPEQKESFIILAFLFSGVVSAICTLFAKAEEKILFNKKSFLAVGIGVAFGFANLCNTVLAGRMPSAVFFPILNISTIFVSLILGVIFFREKLSRNDLVVLLLGIVSILLITVL